MEFPVKNLDKIKNWFWRAVMAFVPLRHVERTPLTPEVIARRYGRGNVLIQSGRIMTSVRYEEQKKRVLAYEF